LFANCSKSSASSKSAATDPHSPGLVAAATYLPPD